MATRRAKVLAEDIEADIVNVVFCDRVPLAAHSVEDRAHWHAVDSDTAKDLALLTAYGAGDIEFLNQTRSNRKATAYFERDTASGEYVLLDREAGVVKPLYVQRKSLAGVRLPPLEPVVIPARDGLALDGYMTLPIDAAASPPPLVLVIHGGPYWRDQWGFNAVHQWLASRGYAVLSVNYRGSTGFGKAFVTAADHEWGGHMHDDLIDAVDWAVAKGIADRQWVGFFGGSYGGYSALMAATKTPEYFALHCRCVRHLEPDNLYENDPALLGTVVQHLEEPARRPGYRSRPRLSRRPLAPYPYRAGNTADLDRAGHARYTGRPRRVGADGKGAQGEGRGGYLHHVP
jgi:dipeptidyl aminopeptidase/acylaminoacyl peptidase